VTSTNTLTSQGGTAQGGNAQGGSNSLGNITAGAGSGGSVTDTSSFRSNMYVFPTPVFTPPLPMSGCPGANVDQQATSIGWSFFSHANGKVDTDNCTAIMIYNGLLDQCQYESARRLLKTLAVKVLPKFDPPKGQESMDLSPAECRALKAPPLPPPPPEPMVMTQPPGAGPGLGTITIQMVPAPSANDGKWVAQADPGHKRKHKRKRERGEGKTLKLDECVTMLDVLNKQCGPAAKKK